MALERGLQFPADPAGFIGDALHLVSFTAKRADGRAISFNDLREKPRGSLILIEQPVLSLQFTGPFLGHTECCTSSGLPQL
jgi:hypothetical protein